MTIEGDETRARLLTAARDLYLEVGSARVSLREVARRSGVSAAAVYRHFDNKQALLQQVCGEGFRIFASYLMRALAAATPAERMVSCAEQYLSFAVENPRDYRVIFMSDADDVIALGPPHLDDGTHDPTFQFLVDRVKECMAAKVIARGDADEVATLIWSHVHGLVSLRLSGLLGRVGNDAAFARLYRHSVDKLLAGLAP
jgi:AcrR family transcriptional regulator